MPPEFRELLRKWRNERGYGVAELARISDTQNPTISMVENGKRTPPMDSVEKWASALKLEGADPEAFSAKAHAKSDTTDYVREQEEKLATALIEQERAYAVAMAFARKYAPYAVKALDDLWPDRWPEPGPGADQWLADLLGSWAQTGWSTGSKAVVYN